MHHALEIPMSIDEYHLLERRLGWQYDYECGHAIVSPADIVIDVSRSTTRPVAGGSFGSFRLCLVEEDQAFGLQELYFDALRLTVETSGVRDEDVRGDGMFSMIQYASGACGRPMACSRAIVDGNTPIAALLVVEPRTGPVIHLLVVHPRFQRRGLASGLLGEVCAALSRHGFQEIRSRYLLANVPSRRWYRKMGFTEQPDAAAVEHHRHFYHYERARLEGSGSAELRAVEQELDRWQRLAARA